MKGYIGERIVPAAETPFANFTKLDWICYYIGSYGGIDGEHHKQWVLDQVLRIRFDAPIEIKLAEWADAAGKVCTSEYRVDVGEPSPGYVAWVAEHCEGEDGPNTYEWDPGIPP